MFIKIAMTNWFKNSFITVVSKIREIKCFYQLLTSQLKRELQYIKRVNT